MFQSDKLPSEMVTKIWVCDDEGNELGIGYDVDALRDALRDQMTERFEEETGAEYDFKNMRSWDCGDLPERVEAPRGIGYPALVDDGDGVSVKVFTDKRQAEQNHLAGCVRLFLFQNAEHAKYVNRQMPLGMEAKMYLPLLGGKGISQPELFRCVVRGVFSNNMPRDEATFETLSDNGRGDLFAHAETLCDALASAISDYREVVAWLESNSENSNYEEIIEDIQEQIEWLLRDGFATQAGWQSLLNYEVFFSAILERVNRLKANPVNKDLEKMDRILKIYLPWHDHFKNRPADCGLIEAGYALETLRVTLFAPNITIAEAVSEKKIKSLLSDLGVTV